jgi:hypothetical protein
LKRRSRFRATDLFFCDVRLGLDNEGHEAAPAGPYFKFPKKPRGIFLIPTGIYSSNPEVCDCGAHAVPGEPALPLFPLWRLHEIHDDVMPAAGG